MKTTFNKFSCYSRLILAVGVSCFVAGCTSAISISPSTTPITGRDTYTKLGYSQGSSTGFMIVGIPIDPSEPSRSARDSAIKNGKGNGLIEVTEEFTMIHLLVFGMYWTKVEGTAVTIEHAGEEIE